jgi:hypothetical protein
MQRCDARARECLPAAIHPGEPESLERHANAGSASPDRRGAV